MKNGLKKLITWASIPFIAGGIANAAFSEGQNKTPSQSQGILFADQKAYDDIATADDLLYGLQVGKSVNSKLYKDSTGTYSQSVVKIFPVGSINRSAAPGWNGHLTELGKMADREGNKNGIVEDGEASWLLDQELMQAYKRQYGVTWAQ